LTGPLGRGAGPSDADIRRAISNAYYAVFHLLVMESTDLLCPPNLPRLATRFRRGFAHGGMKAVCVAVARGHSSMPPLFSTLFPQPLDTALTAVADAFETLQTDRHLADYDTTNPISLGSAQASVLTARRAIAAWQTIRGTDDAKIFLTALPMHGNWQKN